MKRTLPYLLLMMPLIGCAVPVEVKVAQSVKAQALQNFLVNDAKIDAVLTTLWKRSRDTAIAKTAETATQKVLSAVAVPRVALDATGKPTGPPVKTLTAPQAVELSTVIHTAIQKQNANTARVLAKLKTLRDANASNLARHADLEAALNDYLSAGVDTAVVSELTAYLIETVTTTLNKDK